MMGTLHSPLSGVDPNVITRVPVRGRQRGMQQPNTEPRIGQNQASISRMDGMQAPKPPARQRPCSWACLGSQTPKGEICRASSLSKLTSYRSHPISKWGREARVSSHWISHYMWIIWVDPNVIARVFVRGRQRGMKQLKQEVGGIWGRGCEPRNAGNLQELERAWERILP